MTFCRNCGAVLVPEIIACPRCGKSAAPQAYLQTAYPNPVYAAYPQRPALPVTNIYAILGFVTALLPIPFAWLVLSIIGLAQCARLGQKGIGLAIAGIILRVLILAALIGGIALLAYYGNAGSFFPQWDWYDGFAFTALGMR